MRVLRILTHLRHRPAFHVAVAKPVQTLSECPLEWLRYLVLSLGADMRRRQFLGVLGGAAAAWPLAARGQQSAQPVISLFNSGNQAVNVRNLTRFREGQNVAIELHWAENRFDRLADLATDVVARRPAVIVSNTLAALQLKAATATVPIVFTTGSDPIRDGLVTSMSRPRGNITGVVFISGTLGAKRLELLRQFVPKATGIALLVHPGTPETEGERKDVQAAAQLIGRQVDVLEFNNPGDIETAFATLASRQTDAVLIGTGTFTNNNRGLIVALASRYAIPTMYATREYVEAGGLMSYGASMSDAYHQAGLYAGRILKGEKPGDLPIVQSTKFEFVLNLNAAKALKLEFHPQLLATADEVIE
jgi:putative ABC transport system substrate-binding protein